MFDTDTILRFIYTSVQNVLPRETVRGTVRGL